MRWRDYLRPHRTADEAFKEADVFCRIASKKTGNIIAVSRQRLNIICFIYDKKSARVIWEHFEPVKADELKAIDKCLSVIQNKVGKL